VFDESLHVQEDVMVSCVYAMLALPRYW